MSAMNVDSAGASGSASPSGSPSPMAGQLPAGATATPDEVLPIAILMDELKAEDIAVRIDAVRRLTTIALALGPERSRLELIPFLEESVDDDDEVLRALAVELGGFAEYIGGPAYAHMLLGTLETLAAVEETVVRDAAVEAIGKIAAILSPHQIEESLVPLIKRLSAGEWFTSKTSACGLYAHAYPHARQEVQDELRRFYANLVHDDTPMVRRAAATNLPAFIEKISTEHLKNEFFTLFVELAADDQDSVQLLTIPIYLSLAKRVEVDTTRQRLVPVLLQLISAKSWRVRYMAATHFLSIMQSICGPNDLNAPMAAPGTQDLLGAYVNLLRDHEAEVRAAAAAQLPGVCTHLKDVAIVVQSVIPQVKDLVTDANQHVRAAVAAQVSSLAPILGKEHTAEHLLALFLQLLKDEFSEVRLNLISKLEHVNRVIGIDQLAQSLLPAIVELAEDKQWRVRSAIIDYMPLLARQLGVEFFNAKLGPLCMAWLADPVFAIRDAGCQNLRKLAEVFGNTWARDALLPQIANMANDQNHLARMTTVLALTYLSNVLPEDQIRASVMPIITKLAADAIPNIRFNVAKAIEQLIPVLKSSKLSADVLPILQKLSGDMDADVRYFATRAMGSVNAAAA